MKAGFEALAAESPASPWILSNYVQFACCANDETTYAVLRAKLRLRIEPGAFANN